MVPLQAEPEYPATTDNNWRASSWVGAAVARLKCVATAARMMDEASMVGGLWVVYKPHPRQLVRSKS